MVHQLGTIDYQHTELYERIQSFTFDQPSASLSFSRRLARENTWSNEYTERVIEEYRKFVFLAVMAGHPVTPSDQVDQVWHLHLTYTRSYWQEFCPNILQMPLHHEPTRGGTSEQVKFDNWYGKTIESYTQFFGEIPPIDIWPKSKERFGRDLNFQRVNTQQHWVLPKPDVAKVFAPQSRSVAGIVGLLILPLAITGCQPTTQSLNPMNFTGPDFLIFYAVTSVISFTSAIYLRNRLRLPTNVKNQRDVLNPYEVAFLSDGKERMVKAAIASLVKRGYVEVAKTSDLKASLISGSRKLVLIKTPESTANSIEKAVARAVQSSDGSLNQVMAKAVHLEQNLRERLQRLGMLVSDEQAVKAQLYPILIMVGLIGLGLCKILVGITRGKPVGFLMIAVFMILAFGLGFLRKPSRSQYGDQTLKDLTARSRDLRNLQDETNLALAVALFGTSVLRNDGALMDLYRMFPHPNDDDDRMSPHYYSSSTNDDSGAGEGSGGGCGGCGGGGD